MVDVTAFDWGTLSAARYARPDAIAGMVGHALWVLEDLLEDADHGCTFTVADGPWTSDGVTASVNALLPGDCRVSHLEPVSSWSALVREALPRRFVPGRPPSAWSTQAPARVLAEALADWVVALLARLWPASAQAWEVTVETGSWYEADYIDLAVGANDRVWLLHLGVSD